MHPMPNCKIPIQRTLFSVLVRLRWIASITAILILYAGCGREKPRFTGPFKKISIGVSTWPGSASLFIAREKGFFRDAGLDASVITYPSGHSALADALSGTVDFTATSETPIVTAISQGAPVSILATLAYIEQSMVIVGNRDRGITSGADLRGRRIGVTAGTAGEFFLHVFLTTSSIDPARTAVIDIPADGLAGALANGEVDAVCTWAPFSLAAQEMLGRGAIVLDIPEIYTMTWNLVTTRDLPGRDPEAVKRLLRAISMANEYIRNHPDDARTIVAQELGIEIPVLRKQWTNYLFTLELDRKLILVLEDQARWLDRKKGGTGKSPNFLDNLHAAGLRAVQPQAMRIVMNPEREKGAGQ